MICGESNAQLEKLALQVYADLVQRIRILDKLGRKFRFNDVQGSRIDLLLPLINEIQPTTTLENIITTSDIDAELISIPELCQDKRRIMVQYFFGPIAPDSESIAVARSAGYVFEDFIKLEKQFKLVLAHLMQGSGSQELDNTQTDSALAMAQEKYVPLNGIEPTSYPEWLPFYGYDGLRAKLLQTISIFQTQKDFKSKFGINPISGILIHGQSGVGKSHLVNTVIKESGMNRVNISLSKVYSKYLGESEESLRKIFKTANANTPCVVVIENLDALGVKREMDKETSGVDERVLSTLLNELDGIDDSRRVFLIGMTSRVDEVDDALKRPGRFDSMIEMLLPTADDRMQILKGICKELHLCSIKMNQLVELSDKFTPADLVAWCREAFFVAYEHGREIPMFDDFVIVIEKRQPWKPACFEYPTID